MEGYRERMAEKIRDQLTAKNIGPGELADKVSASQRTVERWLSGEVRPQRRYMRSLTEVLEIDEDELLPDMPPNADTLERIEAKLDLLLAKAGLPVDFEAVVQDMETTIAQAGQPGDSTGTRNGEQPPASEK